MDDNTTDPLAELSTEERQALAEVARASVEGRVDRRDLLKAGGYVGLGALLGGGSSYALAQPAAADPEGQAGTAADPISTVFADSVDANSFATIEVVKDGESIQTAINSLGSTYGRGRVIVEADAELTESGITIPNGIIIEGAGDAADTRNSATAPTVQPDSDEDVFTFESGGSNVKNLRVDVTNVAGYSSAAFKWTDANDYNRWQEFLRNVHLVGTRGDTNGSAALELSSSNGNGIAWIAVSNLDIEGFNYGIHQSTSTSSDYVNGCKFQNIAFGGTTEVVKHTLASGAAIAQNIYELGGNGSANVSRVIDDQGRNNTWTTTLFDLGVLAQDPIRITDATNPRLRCLGGTSNAAITGDPSGADIMLSFGGQRFKRGAFGFGNAYVNNLSGESGDFDGEYRADDGTNTTNYGTLCRWRSSDSTWYPVDGSTPFS